MICGIPDDEFMKRYYVAAEKLRRFEGDALELIADDGEHDSKVGCCGEWTNFENEYFTGVNVMLALEAAAAIWAERYRNNGVPESRLGDTDWDGRG